MLRAMWKSWLLRPSVSIDRVIVSDLDGDPRYSGLPSKVHAFVKRALEVGYVADELPREAVIASHVLAYEAEVYNGGHVSGFLGNLGVDHARWDLIGEGLDRIVLERLHLPQTELTNDIHCVTQWSRYDNLWQGVRARDRVVRVERVRGSAGVAALVDGSGIRAGDAAASGAVFGRDRCRRGPAGSPRPGRAR